MVRRLRYSEAGCGEAADVDSQSLVCKARFGEEELPVWQFNNNAVGHRQFIKWARHRGAAAWVCMEATGVYSLPFALALHHEGVLREADRHKGKKPLQALVAIMRKLLLAIWGMFRNSEEWHSSKFYKITQMA